VYDKKRCLKFGYKLVTMPNLGPSCFLLHLVSLYGV